LVCYNLKAGVAKACFHEPRINRTYAERAAHYDVAVIPARPYTSARANGCCRRNSHSGGHHRRLAIAHGHCGNLPHALSTSMAEAAPLGRHRRFPRA